MHRYKMAWYSIRPPVSTRDFDVSLEAPKEVWGIVDPKAIIESETHKTGGGILRLVKLHFHVALEEVRVTELLSY